MSAAAASSMGSLGTATRDRLLRIARGDIKPIATPWESVNRELGGGYRAGSHNVIGNPKTGKTQWAVQFGLHAAKNGTPVVYVALELSKGNIYTRMIALLAGVPWSALELGELPPERVEQIFQEWGPVLDRLPIEILERPALMWSPSELGHVVDSLRSSHPDSGTPLVFIDYLQLVGSKSQHDDLRLCIREAAYEAREVARSKGAAVVSISATARANYGQLDSRLATRRTNNHRKGSLDSDRDDVDDATALGSGPAIKYAGLGKESGEIEYACDSVIALVRDDQQSDEVADALIYVAFALTRLRPNGATEWARIRFDGSRFTDDDSSARPRAKKLEGF